MEKRTKVFFFTVAILFSLSNAFSQTEGERLFRTNQAFRAAEVLESEILSGNVTKDTYNYLGLSYFQNGEYEKSMDAFERGMKSPVSNKKVICFNQGNVAYARGDYAKAYSCYSLALAVSSDFYPALLNRANCSLASADYAAALSDYRTYISRLPDDAQAESIRRVISYLEEQIAFMAEEEKRIAAENERMRLENERIQAEIARKQAEEAARLEAEMALEAERRRKLLEEVANSLQQTDTMNMTAGAETVLEYDYESELD